MWLFVVCSLALAQGALSKVRCSKDAFDVCKAPAFFDFIPTGISKFNRLCPQLPAFVTCLKEFEDQCGQEIFASEEEYEGMYGAFSEICEEGTFLNRVATENLRCFNKTFGKTSCMEKTENVVGSYRDEDDNSLPVEMMCLEDILDSSCIAFDIGRRCGQEALEATMEFLRRTFYVEENCGEGNAEFLLKNLDEYDLDKKQKTIVVAMLENLILSGTKEYLGFR